MANDLSPGVSFFEQNVSQTVPSVTTDIGGIVIASVKGPVNVLTLLTNPSDLVNIFGEPNDSNYTHFFTANAFLQQSNQLYAVRVEAGDKAVAGLTVGISATGMGNLVESTPTTKPTSSFPLAYSDIKLNEAKINPFAPPGTGAGELDNPANALYTEDIYHFYGVGPGPYYNNISVVVVNASDWFQLTELKLALAESTNQTAINTVASMYYNGTPATTASPAVDYLSNSLIKYDIFTPPTTSNSNWFVNTGLLNTLTAFEVGPSSSDEAILIVFDELGSPVETYMFSNNPNAKDALGNNIFGPTLVNGNSSYIYFFIGNSTTAAPGLSQVTTRVSFLGDADQLTGEAPGTGLADLTSSILTAWEQNFTNSEQLEVDLLLDPDYPDAVKQYMDQIASQIRLDCMAVLSMPLQYMLNPTSYRPIANPYTSMKNYVANTLNINSSYSAIYGNYFQIFDQYNNTTRWVPAAGFCAAVMAFTTFSNALWFAPAGLNRGIISNVQAIAVTPNKAQRDVLYYNRINPITNFTGEGIVIWGQKTMVGVASAFDRINVRRLFLYMEKSITKMARAFVFELNNAYTQKRFVGQVTPFLTNIQAGQGIYDFLVICDSTNNTPEVVDANEFIGDILVKPTRVAEFIKLTFVAVATGIAFSEVVVNNNQG